MKASNAINELLKLLREALDDAESYRKALDALDVDVDEELRKPDNTQITLFDSDPIIPRSRHRSAPAKIVTKSDMLRGIFASFNGDSFHTQAVVQGFKKRYPGKKMNRKWVSAFMTSERKLGRLEVVRPYDRSKPSVPILYKLKD